ncbi:MAG: hypothetical protein WBQ92_19555, partial [Pseudomonas alloputida]
RQTLPDLYLHPDITREKSWSDQLTEPGNQYVPGDNTQRTASNEENPSRDLRRAHTQRTAGQLRAAWPT